MVKVIGHRGFPALFPENTMRSFDEALMSGVDMIELDVHLTSDGMLVVMHDETVDRTTDGTGRISGMTFEEISTLDAGGGEKVPLLTEVLDRFSGKCGLNIELKGEGTAAPVTAVLEEEVRNGRWKRTDILLSSFSPVELFELHEMETPFDRAVLVDRNPSGSEEFAVQVGASAVHPKMEYLTREFVNLCMEFSLRVNVWTVNSIEEILGMLKMNVDGLITDRPDLAVNAIGSIREAAPP